MSVTTPDSSALWSFTRFITKKKPNVCRNLCIKLLLKSLNCISNPLQPNALKSQRTPEHQIESPITRLLKYLRHRKRVEPHPHLRRRRRLITKAKRVDRKATKPKLYLKDQRAESDSQALDRFQHWLSR